MSRNLLPLYRRLIATLLFSGILLAALMPIGVVSFSTLPFRVLWAAHIVAHLTTVTLVVYLWAILARQTGRAAILYGVGTLGFLLVSAAVGSLPIVSRDALIYHLAVPKWWLLADRVVEVPWHEWSHFPLMLSGAYAGFLQLGLERVTPLYHLSYLVVLAGMVMAFAYYKFQDAELALLGGGIAVAMPLAVKLGSEPMADLAVAVFFGLAVVVVTVWTELRAPLRAVTTAGIALGLAFSTKYNALLAGVIALPTAALFLKRLRYPFRSIAQALGVVAAVALILYLPWPLKNAVHTGNPLYPFLASVFGGADELPFLGEVGPIRYRLDGYGESILDLCLIPFRMLFFGQDDSPRQFDGLLSPILLFALGSVLTKRDLGIFPWIRFYGALCSLYFVSSLFLFYALVRYQMPVIFPLLSLMTAGILAVSELRGGIYQSRIYRGVFVAQLLWCGFYSVALLGKTHALEYLVSEDRPSDYLRRHLSEYRVAEAVNAKLPENAVVYLLFTGNRYYYYDRAVRGAYFSAGPILAALKVESSSEAVLAAFRRQGVTHLAIHDRRTMEALQTLGAPERLAWTTFVQTHLRLIEEDRGVGIYELVG